MVTFTSKGESGNLDKGVMIRFFLLINHDRIEDIKFQTFGCITSIASSSMLTEIVKGKFINEVEKLEAEDISSELGGVPQEKMYCCNLAIEAFRESIKKAINL
jgi:nitrogen fixation NifU-like protein